MRFKLKILMLRRDVDVKWRIGWGDGVGEECDGYRHVGGWLIEWGQGRWRSKSVK